LYNYPIKPNGLLMRPEFYFYLLFRQVKPFMHSVKKEAIEGGEI